MTMQSEVRNFVIEGCDLSVSHLTTHTTQYTQSPIKYKEQSYKERRWNFGKIQGTNTEQVKIKERIICYQII